MSKAGAHHPDGCAGDRGGLAPAPSPRSGVRQPRRVIDEIRDHLAGAHMVFVTAGMGRWGPAPARRRWVARCAKELGILTVGVVTKPFHFEGVRRMRMAEAGHPGAAQGRRHAAHHPEPEPVPRGEREDDLCGRLCDGRPGALFRRRLASPI